MSKKFGVHKSCFGDEIRHNLLNNGFDIDCLNVFYKCATFCKDFLCTCLFVLFFLQGFV